MVEVGDFGGSITEWSISNIIFDNTLFLAISCMDISIEYFPSSRSLTSNEYDFSSTIRSPLGKRNER